ERSIVYLCLFPQTTQSWSRTILLHKRRLRRCWQEFLWTYWAGKVLARPTISLTWAAILFWPRRLLHASTRRSRSNCPSGRFSKNPRLLVWPAPFLRVLPSARESNALQNS